MMTPGEQRAVREAQSTYKKYYILDPTGLDLLSILGAENILYKEIILNSCLGNLIRAGNGGIVNINTKIENPQQKRFTIAHELGHWYLHAHKNVFACTSEDLNYGPPSRKELESEANIYASELLLPENSVHEYCRNYEFSADLFFQLSQKYNVSLTAASIKYAKIYPQQVCILFCQKNQVIWAVTSQRFPFLFFGPATYPIDSLTGLFFRKTYSSPQRRVHEARSWFSNNKSVGQDDYIEELIIPMTKLNACLTFIRQYKLEI